MAAGSNQQGEGRRQFVMLGGAGGGGSVSWGAIGGTLTSQADLVTYVAAQIALSQYIDGEVATYSDLPIVIGTPPLDVAYLVHTASGTWLINRKPAGIYIRTGNAGALSDWTYAGEFVDIFNDANFAIYDNGDSSKQVQFQVSGVSTSTTRVMTVPNASGTLALTATSVQTSSLGTNVATALGVNVGSAGAFVVLGGALGTPSSGVATNLTGTAAGLTAGVASAVAVGGITGLGTGVATVLAVNVGSAGAPVVFNGAGGTPSALTGTNITGTAAGLTAGVASAVAVGGITGLGSNIATALAVAVGTDGAPVIKAGALGTPSSGVGTNITGLVPANLVAGTLGVNITIGENVGILVDAALSADGKFSIIFGDIGTLGETVAFGETIYFKAADSKWWKTDADAAATAGPVRVGFCCVAGNANGATTIMFVGKIRADSLFATFTLSGPLFLSGTAGAITQTEPSGTDKVVRSVGHADTADSLWVQVENAYIITQ